jgi:glycosyltransferase involved in cell wall biosynthesis
MSAPDKPRLKVLHVIPSLAAADGGPSRALALMERALAAQGVTVETAATDDAGPGRRNGKPAGAALSENGAVRRYFPKRLEFYKVSPGLARWLLRHAGDYELVHIHALFSFASAAAAWAAWRAGVPYIVRPLGTLTRYGVGRRRPWLKRLSLAWVEGPLLRRAKAVHFTSEAERLEAEALGVPLRGAVIPLGIEPGPEADGEALRTRFPALRGRRCVLFLSRLDPKKNLEGLLRAFALAQAEFPDALLLVAGDGAPAYAASLKSLAERLGLAGRVVWAGHLDGALKADAFALAEIFALPSLSENFGIAAAEALMAGVPCLLGEGVAIAAEVERAGAGLAVAPDPDSILRGLARLLRGDMAQARQAAAALAREQYSAQAMGERLARLYADIASAGRPENR